ncbi:hypothetical protein MRX96_021938 [Rhipicephalus microplus]
MRASRQSTRLSCQEPDFSRPSRRPCGVGDGALLAFFHCRLVQKLLEIDPSPGTLVAPGSCCDPGGQTPQRGISGHGKNFESNHAQPTSRERNVARKRIQTLQHVTAASRLPAIPRCYNQVIVRPGASLKVQACNLYRILAALIMVAQLVPSMTEEDNVFLNLQDGFVVSMPSATNATHSRGTEIIVTD